MAYIGSSPVYFPNYAYAANNIVATQGLSKSYGRISRLNKIKKESQRTFILTCSECLTEFIVNDLDIEIVCPICNEIEMD